MMDFLFVLFSFSIINFINNNTSFIAFSYSSLEISSYESLSSNLFLSSADFGNSLCSVFVNDMRLSFFLFSIFGI